MRALRLSLDSDDCDIYALEKKKVVYAKLNKPERDRDNVVHTGDIWKVKYTPLITDYGKVIFHRDTSNITMGFKISNIQIIKDNPEWVEIKLGERL